jgi:hypothetical protein
LTSLTLRPDPQVTVALKIVGPALLTAFLERAELKAEACRRPPLTIPSRHYARL